MTGLELSKAYYEQYGAPMLHIEFPEIEKLVAIGLTGSGSECYGYDDEVSCDHDFEPGFCIFIPDEKIINRQVEFNLERAYSKLPNEFLGYKRNKVSPVGGKRKGVIRAANFWKQKIGNEKGILSDEDWLFMPDSVFAEAVNGEIFIDESGFFTEVRNKLKRYPEDIKKKKLAGNLLMMDQSGLYNYERCILHGETAAAQLAIYEFVKSCMHVVFLLNDHYMPYYKWCFRAMRELKILSQLAESLEYLLTTDNDEKQVNTKLLVIKDIALLVIDEINNQGLISAKDNELEHYAYALNDSISNEKIRNMNILCALD